MNIEQLDGDVIAWGVKKGKSSNWSVWHKSFPLLQLPSLWAATTETPKHNSKLFSQILILNQKSSAEEGCQMVIQQNNSSQIFHHLSWNWQENIALLMWNKLTGLVVHAISTGEVFHQIINRLYCLCQTNIMTFYYKFGENNPLMVLIDLYEVCLGKWGKQLPTDWLSNATPQKFVPGFVLGFTLV